MRCRLPARKNSNGRSRAYSWPSRWPAGVDRFWAPNASRSSGDIDFSRLLSASVPSTLGQNETVTSASTTMPSVHHHSAERHWACTPRTTSSASARSSGRHLLGAGVLVLAQERLLEVWLGHQQMLDRVTREHREQRTGGTVTPLTSRPRTSRSYTPGVARSSATGGSAPNHTKNGCRAARRRSATAPPATTRPARSTITSSAMRSTSLRMWEERRYGRRRVPPRPCAGTPPG